MRVLVILNPYANHSQAKERTNSVRDALSEANLQYEVAIPGYRGESERLAASASGFDAVIAAGGDGTVNEVVNGLLATCGDGPSKPLGILPLGTGNDFSDMTGLPRNLKEAARIIAGGKVRQIDAGSVSYSSLNGKVGAASDWHSRYFDNSCGIAMEPAVAYEVERMTRLSGNIRYVVGIIRGFLKLRSWQVEVHWDGGCFVMPTLLLSVANSPRTGGVFNVAPGASLDDGMFDVVFAPEMPKLEVLSILPRLFKGSHVKHQKISTFKTTRLWIRSKPGTPMHVDGELVTDSAKVASYQVLPGKITLLSP
jgi:YegS/Rv2252/BmrU family lipid kinase